VFVNIATFHTQELSCSTLGNFRSILENLSLLARLVNRAVIPAQLYRVVTLSYLFHDNVVLTCDCWRVVLNFQLTYSRALLNPESRLAAVTGIVRPMP